jgi:hypothetical protein
VKKINKSMPTFFTALGLRFFMVMYDIFKEPFHVHVSDGKKKICKFWIFENEEFELADNKGFSKVEIKRISIVLQDNGIKLKESYEYICKEVNASANYKKKRK